jgi:hypothetical protein
LFAFVIAFSWYARGLLHGLLWPILAHCTNQTGKRRSKYKAVKNVNFEPPIAARDNLHEANPEFGTHDHQQVSQILQVCYLAPFSWIMAGHDCSMACAIRYCIFAGFVSTFLCFMSVRLCAWFFSIHAQSQRTLNLRTGNLTVPNDTLGLVYTSSKIAFA